MAKIPLLKPNPPPISEWSKYLEKSYEASCFSNNGPCVSLLEERLQTYLGLEHKPVLMSNATVALTVVLQAFGIELKQVLVPSFTFAATAHSVLASNNIPRFVDINLSDWQMSLSSAKKNLPASAMVVVQSLGYVADYARYEAFADEHDLPLIFDSAALLGADYMDGKKVGTAGDCEVFSLHITKTFGIGEGALVTSKHKQLLDTLRVMINFGFDGAGRTQLPGTNCKMSDFHAAVGLSVLDTIHEKMARKKAVVDEYNRQIDGRALPISTLSQNSAYQVMPLLLPSASARNLVAEALTANEIGNKIYYTSLHQHPYFKDLPRKDLPNSEYISDQVLCVPLFETMTMAEVATVMEVIESCLF